MADCQNGQAASCCRSCLFNGMRAGALVRGQTGQRGSIEHSGVWQGQAIPYCALYRYDLYIGR